MDAEKLNQELYGKPISDTKRYSMLGNSVAVPCVAYIMQGIRDVLRKKV